MIPQVKERIEQIRCGEVPEGYRRTKAGVIPSEWELCPLSRCLTESRIPGTNGAIAKKLTVKLWNKGVFEKREVHEGSESTTYYKRKAGQLIYSKLDFLNCAFGIIPDHLNDYESTQDLPCFDIKDVDPYYLLTYVTQRNFYTHFGMIADGGRKARRVGPEDMLSFPLVYPSLAEQERIAEILSAQDKLIALKERLIEEKKRQKKYLMQQLLTGKKRLSGFSSKWGSVLFKECITEVDNRSNESNQHPILSVTKDGIVYQADHFNKQIASDNNIGYKIIKRNQLAFSILNLWMGSVDVLTLCDVGIVSPAYKVFECVAKNLTPSFAKYFLRSYNVVWLYNINSETGASVVRKNLDLAALLNEKLEIPSTDEQEAIAKILETADAEITILQKELDQEKQKKKALMQLLLTGIVRV